MKKIILDVSTKYAELMAGFINQPDIPKLFAGYWELYVSQLPEAIFQQVNENFYRTTFFDLRRQHLSGYFTWALKKDIKQLKAYEAEWKKQHPQPGNKSFLVYCFGNQGYRVFPI
jgi:hypothetical protein